MLNQEVTTSDALPVIDLGRLPRRRATTEALAQRIRHPGPVLAFVAEERRIEPFALIPDDDLNLGIASLELAECHQPRSALTTCLKGERQRREALQAADFVRSWPAGVERQWRASEAPQAPERLTLKPWTVWLGVVLAMLTIAAVLFFSAVGAGAQGLEPLAATKAAPSGQVIDLQQTIVANGHPGILGSFACDANGGICGGGYFEAITAADGPLSIGGNFAAYHTDGTVAEVRGGGSVCFLLGGHANECVGLRATAGGSAGSIDSAVGLAVTATPGNVADVATGILVEDQVGASAEWGVYVVADESYFGGGISLGSVPGGGITPLCLDGAGRVATCSTSLAEVLAEVRKLRAEVAKMRGAR